MTIFALTDRGQAFQAAAYTTILLLVTLLALISLGRIRGRAALRCAAPADTRYVLEK